MASCHIYPLLLLKSRLFSYSIIIIHFLLLQTCAGQYTPDCLPSSCGNITDISYPFRLTNDPQYFGEYEYQLTCENNTTLLYLNDDNSVQKYVVRAIDYDNHRIHITDPSILENDNCALPDYSIPSNKIGFYENGPHPYSTDSFIITLISCPLNPVNNSSSLLKIASAADCGYNESNGKYTHILLDDGLNSPWDIMDMCTIELVSMTSSLPALIETDQRNSSSSNTAVSISQIHTSLLHGFQLSWFRGLCMSKCRSDSCSFVGNYAVCDGGLIQWHSFGTIYQFRCDGVPVWFPHAFRFYMLGDGSGPAGRLWSKASKMNDEIEPRKAGK